MSTAQQHIAQRSTAEHVAHLLVGLQRRMLVLFWEPVVGLLHVWSQHGTLAAMCRVDPWIMGRLVLSKQLADSAYTGGCRGMRYRMCLHGGMARSLAMGVYALLVCAGWCLRRTHRLLHPV